MTTTKNSAAAAWDAGWVSVKPDPRLTPTTWADKHRILSGRAAAEPGRYRSTRTPYLVEIMDNQSPYSPIETTVVMKGHQIGFTEAGHNWLGYIIHNSPGPIMYVQPTLGLAKKKSRLSIAPMIADCPVLTGLVADAKSRDGGNTTLMKEFPGGALVVAGANSAADLRSLNIRYLFLDEIDGYPYDVDGEGDPIELAKKRMSTFRRNRKILIGSTPTVKNLSRIEALYEDTDQRRYFVPCPHCGEMQIISWDQIRWPKDARGRHLTEKAYLECAHCKKAIGERYKTRMLARGEWKATAKSKLGPNVRGYHISALYSPVGWYSWAEAAKEFLAAKRKGAAKLKVWINTVLGETFEERGYSVEAEGLLARCEVYPAEVPAGGLLLTAGVDTQDDRLEVEIVAWGPGEESWSIDYRVLPGDPSQRYVWESLDDLLGKTYTREDGCMVQVLATCVDSAGHKTTEVYDYCKSRAGQRVFAIIGRAGETRPVVSSPVKRRTGKAERHVDLFTVGVDTVKATLYSRLQLEKGIGICHFPQAPAYSKDYFQQLTAEVLFTTIHKGRVKREWRPKPGRRSEALDCRVYATGALYILNPIWDSIVEREKARTAGEQENPEVPKVKPVRHEKRNWVTDY